MTSKKMTTKRMKEKSKRNKLVLSGKGELWQ
jgi:hypothetical protein